MKRLRLAIRWIAPVVLVLSATAAQAQATRTWVSGVGDDVNPCSRTAPCKTFAGAISKTATGGEINVLDPGGFGGVTITKSITISAEGVEAGVLVSGTNAIIINTPAASIVVLRGLDIEGLGTGLVGVKLISNIAALHIENCTINGFRGAHGSGIEIAPSTGAANVFIKDTIVRNNGQGTGGGIFLKPGAGATVEASLDNVRMENNVFGLKVQGGSNATVHRSVAAGNAFAGFSTATGSAFMTIEKSVSANNGTGVGCAVGTTVRIGNTTIINNPTPVTPGNACSSFGNNDIDVAVLMAPLNQQ